MIRVAFVLLSLSAVYAVELPYEAQRELAIYTAAVEKAEAERQVKVNAAADKAVKVLNVMSQKAKTVEERRAIDDEILKISKEKMEGDDQGEAKPANPWAGTYKWSDNSTVTVRADSTAIASDGATATGKIDGDHLTLVWRSGSVDTLSKPLPDGSVLVDNHRGMTRKVQRTKDETPK